MWLGGGSGPQPTVGLTKAVRLIRTQNDGIAAYWLGYLISNVSSGGGSGTVTSITAGSGLSGGTITNAGTIAVAPQGVTASMILNNTVTNAQIASNTITVGNIVGGSAAGGDPTLYFNASGGWTAPGGGGVGANFWPVFNVKNSGAVGNGFNDDTAAIQNTIAAVVTNGGGTVYFPPGNYIISSTLVVNSQVNMAGDGCARRSTPLVTNEQAVSQLTWTGASGGTMIKIQQGGGVRPIPAACSGRTSACTVATAFSPVRAC